MRVRVKRCEGGGWYVLGPRALRGSSLRLIVAAGRWELVMLRGR